MHILFISCDNLYKPRGGLGHQVRETILNIYSLAKHYNVKKISVLVPYVDNDSKSYIIKEQNVILNIIEYNKYKLPITKTIDNILFFNLL